MPDSNPAFERLDELIAALLANRITDEAYRELTSQLSGNRDAQVRYIQTMELHEELLRQGEIVAPAIEHSALFEDTYDKAPQVRSNRWKYRLLFNGLVAACLLLASGIGIGHLINSATVPENTDLNANITFASHQEQTDDGAAVLVSSLNVKWTEKAVRSGDILSPGIYAFESGLVQLALYNGVRLIAEGPSRFNVISTKQIKCHSGKWRLIVPSHARDFQLLTAKCQVASFEGHTEFGLHTTVHATSVEMYLGQAVIDQVTAESKRVTAGQGLKISDDQSINNISVTSKFITLDEMQQKQDEALRLRFNSWQAWQLELKNDPRLMIHYDFMKDTETGGKTLINQQDKTSLQNGTIIGATWSTGRWLQKAALDFKRPSDRVRVNIPVSMTNFTICAWVRVDALTNRYQSLLLSDGYKPGYLHWQISATGTLRLGVRVPKRLPKRKGGWGYGSPVLFSPRNLGEWSFLATSYDASNGRLKHYFNGEKVSDHELVYQIPLNIGTGDIGNWSQPLNGSKNQIVRNFQGRMDEMMIWKEALSEKEVMTLYQKGLPI